MGKKKSKKVESTLYVPPVIDHTDWRAAPKREELFSVSRPDPNDPDETIVVTYDMPAKANVGLSLELLRMVRVHGDMVAMAWLLEEAIGTEGFNALTAEPDLSSADLKAIFNHVRRVVLGGLEGPKG